MKISFVREEGYYITYATIGGFSYRVLNGSGMSAESSFENTEYIELIRSTLKKQFSSIDFVAYPLMPTSPVVFNFNEQADEAAFQLWSNNGVEI